MFYRHGFAYYIAPLIQAVNTIILVYFVAGDKIFFIRDTFPHILIFVLFAVTVALPIVILVGYVHYRRAYKSEAQVLYENNPFHYKLIGKDYVLYRAIRLLLIHQLSQKTDIDFEVAKTLNKILELEKGKTTKEI